MGQMPSAAVPRALGYQRSTVDGRVSLMSSVAGRKGPCEFVLCFKREVACVCSF